jgi:5-methyltetrahydrofolate--homocysteine methyltransferase
MDELKQIFDQIVDGDIPAIPLSVKAALNANISAETVLHQALIPAMSRVGELFEEGEFFVPEMLISARAMQTGLNLLKPHLLSSGVKFSGKVVIGTVKGDLHDIGKNLVALMLEGSGFEVVDLGVDVAPEKFVEAASQGEVDIVALSALITTTMSNMKNVIDALKEAGLRDRVKVIIGGAPVTQQFAEQIGADGYSEDASRAVALVKSLIK